MARSIAAVFSTKTISDSSHTMSNPLLVNVAELTRRPGSEKDIDVSVSAEQLEFNDKRVTSTEVPVVLHLESVNGGIAVAGSVSVGWRDACSRCLKPIDGISVARVHELFQQNVTDPDAYPIVGEQLDLTEMVREVLLIEIPTLPLCSESCPGLCPTCGADLANAPCNCAPLKKSSAWDALDQLKGQVPDA